MGHCSDRRSCPDCGCRRFRSGLLERSLTRRINGVVAIRLLPSTGNDRLVRSTPSPSCACVDPGLPMEHGYHQSGLHSGHCHLVPAIDWWNCIQHIQLARYCVRTGRKTCSTANRPHTRAHPPFDRCSPCAGPGACIRPRKTSEYQDLFWQLHRLRYPESRLSRRDRNHQRIPYRSYLLLHLCCVHRPRHVAVERLLRAGRKTRVYQGGGI